MKNLFTVIVTFSNHETGIEQYEEKTPLDALIKFVQFSEMLDDGYDREHIEASLSHLHHRMSDRGIWTFTCNDKGVGIVGGAIIQTDKAAYLRPHH